MDTSHQALIHRYGRLAGCYERDAIAGEDASMRLLLRAENDEAQIEQLDGRVTELTRDCDYLNFENNLLREVFLNSFSY